MRRISFLSPRPIVTRTGKYACGWFGMLLAVTLSAGMAGASGPAKAPAHAPSATSNTQWLGDLQQWRATRARELTAPDGWLTLVGLEWLKPGKNSIGLAADNDVVLKGHAPEHLGIIQIDGQQLHLLPSTAGFPPGLKVNAQPATAGVIASDDKNPAVLTTGNLSLMVLHRGDRFALRIKDSLSQTRTNFKGLRWYPPDPNAVVTARWIPFTPAHTEQIPTVIGTTLDMPAPGIAEFTLKGKTIQLEPVLESPSSKELFFILRDATSRTTTYQSARFLYSGLPNHGLDQPGTLKLDLNRLQNPPCAYTPYATCPLPPYVNRLAVSIEAGEQRYSH